MFNYLITPFGRHYYTLAAVGVKFRSKQFSTRDQAKQYMYNYLSKKGVNIRKVWCDHHDVTYICDGGVNFFIQRV